MAVQAQLADDRPLETADQEVGQHVRAGLGVEQGPQPVRPREHVIAVQPGQPPQAKPRAQLIECPVTAAVRVRQCDRQAARLGRHRDLLGGGRDPVRPVVQ
jgi:hypothetical protein